MIRRVIKEDLSFRAEVSARISFVWRDDWVAFRV